jgi:hypothetical protein
MTPHQTIAVAVRLFAVWVAVSVARETLAFYLTTETRNESHALLMTLIGVFIAAAVALALWFFPKTVAHKLLSSSTPDSTPSASPDLWLAMGCALIGLWLLTFSLPALIRDSLVAYFYPYDNMSELRSELRNSLLYYIAEVGIAVWLIFGARGFRKFFWWARDAGRNRAL